MTRRWMTTALVLFASVAWADERIAQRYEAEGKTLVAEIESYSDRDLAVLSRTTGWKAVSSYLKGRLFLERVAADKDLTDGEKARLVQQVGVPTGRLIVRLNDGFLDGKVIDRTFAQLRAEGWDPFRAFLVKIADFFVRREVAPFRYRERPSEGFWSYRVTAGARALFDRAIRIVGPTVRSYGRLLWPRQSYAGRGYWTVPPAMPFLGSDRVRAAAAKHIAQDVKHAIEEAGKADSLWPLAALGPVVAGLKEAEPFRLHWENQSARNWMLAAAIWFFCNPVELTRHEWGGLEYGTLEAIFFLVARHLHYFNTGIGSYNTARNAVARLDGDGDLAGKAAKCPALLAAEGSGGSPAASPRRGQR